ncbi:extracellular solute-binding protein [Muricomes sp. OA1]|uniref:Extracellular solute-binding protein n=1 Tax=Hungatella hathewayi TaxID=154046 RepID=A0A3E2WW26_9FIRM|nr:MULTISPECIES: extracellular solute-binding protein [Clostridia]MCH1972194.1 extracellular solute-binding protein [Muricomes sp. OA1]MEE0202941.1 extracellular solute-binding protein [Muricomes sp.]MRM90690.1 extracellular solute-binding protein [Faecalicatena contorta]RGC31225.1 extracellular solute-binding protein [Hungatella hathewayi]
MKKRVISVLVMSALLLGLTACGSSGNSADKKEDKNAGNGKITFTFAEHVANIEEQAPQVYAVVQEFMKQNPDIVIDMTGSAQDEHTQKIKLASQSNTLPDLFYSLKGDADAMAEAGLLADISADITDDQEFVDGFLPGMLDVMEMDGAIYGLPAEIFCNGIWYNKALFEECGLEIPVTYDDLIHCAEVFNEKGIVPMARGTKDVWSSWSLMTMHARYGFFDHIDGIFKGTDNWQNDDYLLFYEKLQDMSEKGMFPDNAASLGYWEATEMFLGGKAAMFDSGAWDTKKFDESELKEDIGFWWGPTFSDGIGNQELSMKAPSHPYCVSAKTKEEEPEKYQAIIKFLKFYYGPEGTAIIARDNQSVPVTRYEGEIDAESYPVFAKVMERMNDDWESPETCPNMTLPGQFETTYFESMAGVINGIYTPEEALRYMDEQTEAQGLIQ